MKKELVIVLLVSLVLVSGCFTGLTTSEPTAIPSETIPPIVVQMCQQDDCEGLLASAIQNSSAVDCAFFDLDTSSIVDALSSVQARVVVDAENTNDVVLEGLNVRYDTREAYMHNKFCVLDDGVWLGSVNPSGREFDKNDNNALLIRSRFLRENYNAEFEELWNGQFGKGEAVVRPAVMLNGELFENRFCPEDGCAAKVREVLASATTRIDFMVFSFTDDDIGTALVQKMNEGITVRGVFEKSQNSKYAEYKKLLDAGADVVLDVNPAFLHHKVFIIDNATVVMGSYNPTKNGNEKNDENVLIIHSPAIAAQYGEEFERLFIQAHSPSA